MKTLTPPTAGPSHRHKTPAKSCLSASKNTSTKKQQKASVIFGSPQVRVYDSLARVFVCVGVFVYNIVYRYTNACVLVFFVSVKCDVSASVNCYVC